MTTFKYPAHQRHAKQRVKERVLRLRTEYCERQNESEQDRILNIALSKIRGDELSDEDKAEVYHPSFDDVAAGMLWHMPQAHWQDMIELLNGMSRKDMWAHWVWPRVQAARHMEMGLGGIFVGPSANLPFFFDDEIVIKTAAQSGFPTSSWFEARLKEKPKEKIMKEEPVPDALKDVLRQEQRAVDQERDFKMRMGANGLAPTPPILTPHPVADPWWLSGIKRLFRL
jgi:hypothetical protein